MSKLRLLKIRAKSPQSDQMTRLVVGLGNIGRTYEETRHNVGFMAVDWLTQNWKASKFKQQSKLESYSTKDIERNIILAKPTTLMNLSGRSVKKLMDYYKIHVDNILIIHDDADLEFGDVRLVQNTQSGAGHHGVLSITEQIGPGFKRIRIGIGRPDQPVRNISNYVLSRLIKTEKSKLLKSFKEIDTLINSFLN
jgi:PTH1 family peptidyl-tRNA hydrolase